MDESFSTTERCAFCRGRFPVRSLPGFDAWQSIVRAVVCLDSTYEERIDLTETFRLPDDDFVFDVPVVGQLRKLTIFRAADWTACRLPDPTAFCFHEFCFSTLKAKLKTCENLVLFKLARTLTPDPTIWEDACISHDDPDSTSRLQLLVAAGECFQPRLISRLPVELRTSIWQYIGLATQYSSFIIVASETPRLARMLRCRSPRHIKLQRGSRLSAKMISAFGTEYIQDLIVDLDCRGNNNILGDTTEVKTVLSHGGICAIQVLGLDWKTGWIGKIPIRDCVWYGIIRAPTFQCVYNDLNLASISPNTPSPQQVVWDQPDFPSTLPDPDAALFNSKLDMRHSTNVAPLRRFFRHLSLYCKDEYINGISIHVDSYGTVGLEAHFARTSRLSGYRGGCQLYFPLYLEERIAYVWLRILNLPDSTDTVPSLTIQTTRARMHTFGAYIRTSLVATNIYNWILLQQKGCITGFYHESVDPDRVILRLGITGDGTTPRATYLPPQYHDCDCPFPSIGKQGGSVFLSVAVLSSLERVDICHVDNRCTGMLIHYLDSRTVVLGQWNTYQSRHSCIYNGNEQDIRNIYFRMLKVKDLQIVTSISFSPDTSETPPDSHYQIFTMGQHIAWWFSKRYDSILSWTGDLRSIPAQSMRDDINVTLPPLQMS